MNAVPFSKMHGLGNHFVVVDGIGHALADPGDFARRTARVDTGVGTDGLVLLLPPERPDAADARMRFFNADGSEAEMCGNGIRCLCKFAHDHGRCRARPMRIETRAGLLSLDYTLDHHGRVERVTVDMGTPVFALPDIPVDVRYLVAAEDAAHPGGPPYRLQVEDATLEATFVSMGNPHAVVYVDRVTEVDLPRLGPAVEHHAAFPQRVNAHFVEIRDAGEVVVRTWERGSGATRACGTGAAAVCAAGVRTGRTGRSLVARLPGGDLHLRSIEPDGRIEMTGPAVEVFTGLWEKATE